MATQTVNGNDLSHILYEQTGGMSGDIYRRTIDTSVWLKLVKQQTWPDEMGDTLSVLTYERTLPTAANVWSPINNAAGSTKFSIPDATDVETAQTARTFGVDHTAIYSDPIVVNGIRMGYKFKEQLKNVYENLVSNVSLLWKTRFRDQFTSTAQHKIVAYLQTDQATLVESDTAMPVQNDAPANFDESKISRLTQGILNRCYQQLIRDGGSERPMGRENGSPVFTLITSAETSDNIMRQSDIGQNDAFLQNHSRVSELLAPLGVERSFRGFYHVIDPFPRRWDYTAGAWVEVLAYIEDTSSYAGKQGSVNRDIVNPLFESADYEDSYIFHPEVFESYVPKPLTSGGSGTVFDPISYRGDFRFLNIKSFEDNPDGSWGKFRGVLSNGAKPVRPELGYVIRHKRADAQFSLIDVDGSDLPVTGY